MMDLPGIMSRGNWTAALFVDDKASALGGEGAHPHLHRPRRRHHASAVDPGRPIPRRAADPDHLRDQGDTRIISLEKYGDGAITPVRGKETGQNVVIRNSEYWIGPDVIVSRADKSRFRGFGRNWNLAGRSAEIVKLDWGNSLSGRSRSCAPSPIHIFTACGAALALLALILATGGHWAAMFFCLGLALIVDGVDGPLARAFKVAEVLPRWSGETLDLVVDFVTYVFVPAYAIAASGYLPQLLAIPCRHRRRDHRRALFRRSRDEDRRQLLPRLPGACGISPPSISFCCEPPAWAAAVGVFALAGADLRADPLRASAAGAASARRSISRCWRCGPCWRCWRSSRISSPVPIVTIALGAIAVYFLIAGFLRRPA